MSHYVAAALSTFMLVAPCSARGQTVATGGAASVTQGAAPPSGDRIQWGSSVSTLSLPWSSFVPLSSSTEYSYSLLGNMLCLNRTGGGEPYLEASIHLPTGAAIEGAEVRLCDTNPMARVITFLTLNEKAGNFSHPALVSTTDAETPGCVNQTVVLGSPIVVDNNTTSYSFEVNLGAQDSTTAICDARLHYRLQVSVAPGIATFGDVPVGHPFHRFVEALVAAGITGGCGGGNYCPDVAITRGQMAVFLAAALGLHWPN